MNPLPSNLIHYNRSNKIYKDVLEIFGFDQNKDLEAREILYGFRKMYDPESLINSIQTDLIGKYIYFFGAGPNLMEHIKLIEEKIKAERVKYFIIAADGAARGLDKVNIHPNLIFTDLDGLNFNQIKKFLLDDIIIIIHGHGDNIKKLLLFEPILKSEVKIICTTQVESKYPILNPGGFTDGDRSVYFCHHISPKEKKFHLFGYEFRMEVGTYSKIEYSQPQPINLIKKKKLNLCKELLMDLSVLENRSIEFFQNEPTSTIKEIK